MAAPLAPGVDALGTESAFSVLARARELEATGRDIVHLEIGEPDFPTPAHISEAAFTAVRAGATHYCPSAGLPELREAAAVALSATRGIDVPAARVLVGNGAKPLLFFTILATCGPGDEVWEKGRPAETREIFEQVALSDDFPEFLTVPAYELLP